MNTAFFFLKKPSPLLCVLHSDFPSDGVCTDTAILLFILLSRARLLRDGQSDAASSSLFLPSLQRGPRYFLASVLLA